jgi:hypothetical protein
MEPARAEGHPRELKVGHNEVAEVTSLLHEHFATPVTRYVYGQPAYPPNRLVYLLDHEYTPRALSWTRLKGADAARVSLLRAAAEQAGCAVTLTHWTGPDGRRLEETSLPVSDGEVCASTEDGALAPYAAEYEGYMGDWGNTLDRWYHRAAIAARLQARLELPQRADDDWSVTLPEDGCPCDLCSTLTAFLAHRERRVLEWPLAEQGRRHIHERIDRAELPVTHRGYLQAEDAFYEHLPARARQTQGAGRDRSGAGTSGPGQAHGWCAA